MISKLQKLEAKLSVVDIEDLYTLSIYTADFRIIRHLQKFIVQYSEFYNVNEIFKDSTTKKQSFISFLIQKVFETSQWLRSLPATSSSSFPVKDFLVKRKLLHNLCETLRIVFREVVDFLSLLQHCQLLTAITFVISQRYLLFIDMQRTVLSAYRVLVNVLNKSEERVLIFLLRHAQLDQHPYNMIQDVDPIFQLTQLLYNRISTTTEGYMRRLASLSSSFAEHLLSRRSEGKATDLYSSPSKGTPSKEDGKEWRKEVATESKSLEADFRGEEKVSPAPTEYKERAGRNGREEKDDESVVLADDIIEMIMEDLDQAPSSSSQQAAMANDVQILNYVVKILYMICCQSDEARDVLKQKRHLLRALLYRLSRCLIDEEHFIQVVDLTRSSSTSSETSLADQLPHHTLLPPYTVEARSSKGKATTKMIDFPYSNDNYLLFSTTSRLLYLLDVSAALSPPTASPSPSSSFSVLVDNDMLDYFAADLQVNGVRKRDEIESIDDIHVIVRMRSGNSLNHSIRSTTSNDSNPPSLRVSADALASGRFVIPALDLLDFVILMVLTIAPYNWSLYITDTHQENLAAAPVFYTGNLIHCEEVVLQLLMLASDDHVRALFHYGQQARTLGGPAFAASATLSAFELVDQIVAHRILFLSNSLIRILIIFLQRCKTKNLDLQEKASLLTPVLISLIKLIKADDRSFQIVKRLVFPSVYPPVASASRDDIIASSSKDERAGALLTAASTSTRGGGLFAGSGNSSSAASNQNMHPHDCPENSLRHALIQLMTSLDTNIKRCVAEFIYLLCSENKEEFVYRTGFGNSVALLQLKGIF